MPGSVEVRGLTVERGGRRVVRDVGFDLYPGGVTGLLGTPDLLVLDEPTVGLDPVLRHDLRARFQELADAGATVLVSSHAMHEAVRCDRLLLLRDGELVADDEPRELLRRTGSADVEQAFLSIALAAS